MRGGKGGPMSGSAQVHVTKRRLEITRFTGGQPWGIIHSSCLSMCYVLKITVQACSPSPANTADEQLAPPIVRSMLLGICLENQGIKNNALQLGTIWVQSAVNSVQEGSKRPRGGTVHRPAIELTALFHHCDRPAWQTLSIQRRGALASFVGVLIISSEPMEPPTFFGRIVWCLTSPGGDESSEMRWITTWKRVLAFGGEHRLANP